MPLWKIISKLNENNENSHHLVQKRSRAWKHYFMEKALLKPKLVCD